MAGLAPPKPSCKEKEIMEYVKKATHQLSRIVAEVLILVINAVVWAPNKCVEFLKRGRP